MIVHLQIVGYLLIGLALIHAVFPAYFRWKDELRPLSLINRQMMYVHTFFIALTVLLMGILCATSARDLLETELGHRVVIGLLLFWFCRLAAQFMGYSAHLWRGKRFETTVHVLFSLLWLYVCTVLVLALKFV